MDDDLIIWLHDWRLARDLGLPKDEVAIRSYRVCTSISEMIAATGFSAEEAAWNVRFNHHLIFGKGAG